MPTGSVLSEQELRQVQYQLLTQPALTELLQKAKQLARPVKVYISHAWPILENEQASQPLLRLLQLIQLLQIAGIEGLVDLNALRANSRANLVGPKFVLKRFLSDIRHNCQRVIMLGSSSYQAQAEDLQSFTAQEVTFCRELVIKNKNAVIPILFAGSDFKHAFPEGFSETLGGDFSQAKLFLETLPDVIGNLLMIREVAGWQKAIDRYKEMINGVFKNIDAIVFIDQEAKEISQKWQAQQQALSYQLTELQEQLPQAVRFSLDGALRQQRLVLQECLKEWSIHLPINDSQQTLNKQVRKYQDNVFLGENIMPWLSHLNSGQVAVMLGQANSGKRDILRLTEYLAWSAWQQDPLKQPLPIYIHLHENLDIENPYHHLLPQILGTWGLTAEEIAFIKRYQPLLVLIDGYAEAEIKSNLYLRNHWQDWQVSVIIHCQEEYLQHNPDQEFYFMPSDHLGKPNKAQLTIWPIQSALISCESLTDLTTLISPLKKSNQVFKRQVSRQLSMRPTVSSNTESIFDKVYYQARCYLQSKIHTLALYELGRYLQARSLSSNHKALKKDALKQFLYSHQVFISYAWPPAGELRTQLQVRLQQLVKDCAAIGVNVLLDIEQLTVGTHINTFMAEGIRESDAVFLIGRPELKERIQFKETGEPATNVAFEFSHILAKQQSQKQLILYRLLHGDNLKNCYPDNLPASYNLSLLTESAFFDFTNISTYYEVLPKLWLALFKLEGDEASQNKVEEYLQTYVQREAEFTEAMIRAAQQEAELEAQVAAAKADNLFKEAQAAQEMFKAQLEKNLQASEQARIQSAINKLQAHADCLQANNFIGKALKFYVPAQGSIENDSEKAKEKAEDLFSLVTKHWQQSSDLDIIKIILLIGTSGSGKSLALQALCKQDWDNYRADQMKPIPIVISLPQSKAWNANLLTEAFLQAGLDQTAIELLKAKDIALRIYCDALDEVPVSILQQYQTAFANLTNGWRNMQLIISCRREPISTIEASLQRDIAGYLSQGFDRRAHIQTLYVTPFNKKQIHQYLECVSQSSDGVLSSMEEYQKRFEAMPGINDLIEAPFLLNLICQALPDLEKKPELQDRRINRGDIFSAFLYQFFQKGLWRLLNHAEVNPNQSATEQWQKQCQLWAVQMLDQASSNLSRANSILELDETTQLSLRQVLPIKETADTLSFIHKSMQEYFVAKTFLSSCSRLGESRLPNSDHFKALTLKLWNHYPYLLKQEGVMYFLRDLITDEDEDLLWEFVSASKHKPENGVAASIAITILNMRGRTLSGKDLSFINIPNADLSTATCSYTNFTGSNLRGVMFKNAYLDHTIFDAANMEEVCIEQEYSGKCFSIEATGYKWSPRQELIVVYGRETLLIDPHAMRVIAAQRGVNMGIKEFLYLDNYLLWMWVEEHNFTLLKIADGKVLEKIQFSSDLRYGGGIRINDIVLSSDGLVAIILQNNATIHFVDVGHFITKTYQLKKGLYCSSLSPDKSVICLYTNVFPASIIYLMRFSDATVIACLEEKAFKSLQFSLDGSELMLVARDSSIVLIRVNDGEVTFRGERMDGLSQFPLDDVALVPMKKLKPEWMESLTKKLEPAGTESHKSLSDNTRVFIDPKKIKFGFQQILSKLQSLQVSPNELLLKQLQQLEDTDILVDVAVTQENQILVCTKHACYRWNVEDQDLILIYETIDEINLIMVSSVKSLTNPLLIFMEKNIYITINWDKVNFNLSKLITGAVLNMMPAELFIKPQGKMLIVVDHQQRGGANESVWQSSYKGFEHLKLEYCAKTSSEKHLNISTIESSNKAMLVRIGGSMLVNISSHEGILIAPIIKEKLRLFVYSPNETFLVLANEDTVILIRVKDGYVIARIKNEGFDTSDYSLNETVLILKSSKMALLINTNNGEILIRLEIEDFPQLSVLPVVVLVNGFFSYPYLKSKLGPEGAVFSPYGAVLLFWFEGVNTLIRFADKEEVVPLTWEEDKLRQAYLSPNGTLLVLCGQRAVSLFNVRNGEFKQFIGMESLQFWSANEYALINKKSVTLISDGKTIAHIDAKEIHSLRVSPDGTVLVMWSKNLAILLSLVEKKLITYIEEEEVQSVCFSPNSTMLLLIASNRSILVRVKDGSLVTPIIYPEKEPLLFRHEGFFSSDSSILVFESSRQRSHFFFIQTESGILIKELVGHHFVFSYLLDVSALTHSILFSLDHSILIEYTSDGLSISNHKISRLKDGKIHMVKQFDFGDHYSYLGNDYSFSTMLFSSNYLVVGMKKNFSRHHCYVLNIIQLSDMKKIYSIGWDNSFVDLKKFLNFLEKSTNNITKLPKFLLGLKHFTVCWDDLMGNRSNCNYVVLYGTSYGTSYGKSGAVLYDEFGCELFDMPGAIGCQFWQDINDPLKRHLFLTIHNDKTLKMWDITDFSRIQLIASTGGSRGYYKHIQAKEVIGLSQHNQKLLANEGVVSVVAAEDAVDSSEIDLIVMKQPAQKNSITLIREILGFPFVTQEEERPVFSKSSFDYPRTFFRPVVLGTMAEELPEQSVVESLEIADGAIALSQAALVVPEQPLSEVLIQDVIQEADTQDVIQEADTQDVIEASADYSARFFAFSEQRRNVGELQTLVENTEIPVTASSSRNSKFCCIIN